MCLTMQLCTKRSHCLKKCMYFNSRETAQIVLITFVFVKRFDNKYIFKPDLFVDLNYI